MIRALVLSLFFYLPTLAYGQMAVTIFEVRKTLAMSDDDPVYRDFYVNGGSEVGLSVGAIMTVRRRLPLYDSYQNRSAGDLDLRVARVKVIHVQRGLAVVRLHSEFSREQTPLLEDNFIMVGDMIDLQSATREKVEKKTAAVESRVFDATYIQPVSASPQLVINSVEISSEDVDKSSSASSSPRAPLDLPSPQ